MYHHDGRDYAAAVAETDARFQAELEGIIEKGRASAGALIERISGEVPKDTIAASRSLTLQPLGNGRFGLDEKSTGMAPLHDNAIAQICDRYGIPSLYRSKLAERGDFGAGLLADNLNRLIQHDPVKPLLVREVNGEVRAVLSNAFRRMDSRPIVETFASACHDFGAVPVEGVGGDLRWEIKALLPTIYRPGVDGTEALALGIALSNSDFGCGALSMRMFCLRVWCTNYAKLEEALRQIHLGKRLGDNAEFSERTLRLDTETMVSATGDLVRSLLAPEKVEGTLRRISDAMNREADPKTFLAGLGRRGLLKMEVEQVEETLLSGSIRQLPMGNTAYRMSNAISWVAKSAVKAERRLELEEIAGQLLVA
jgi:hypothetical protein